MLDIAPDKLQSTLGLKLPPSIHLPSSPDLPSRSASRKAGRPPCSAVTPRVPIPTPTPGTAGRSSPRIC